jgi:hypothetical protein
MKRLTKAAIFAVSVALLSQAAHAGSFVNNDLYLGFSGPSSYEYVIDLGQPGTVGVGRSSVVNLSGDFSLSVFQAVFSTSGTTLTNISAGVVGGNTIFPGYDVYTTELRVGGAGNPAVAGYLDLSGNSHSSGSMSTAADRISTMGPSLPSAGFGETNLTSSTTSFYTDVAPTFTAQSFSGATGINPLGKFDDTGVLYEDLWGASTSSPYTYLGFFTLDPGTGYMNFNPSAAPVPEPTVLSVFGGGAFLLWGLRRRLERKNA